MSRAAWWVALALLCVAVPAGADPFSSVAILSTFASGAAGAGTFLGLSASTWFYVGIAASALGAVNSRRKARAQQAAAKAKYNAGLQDRTVSVLRTDPPWQVIYGRAIVGGAYVDIITTDKSDTNENGGTYFKADAYKTLVLLLAAHEVQAINEVYIDGVPVGMVDGNGWAAAGSSATVTFTHASSLVNWTSTPAVDGNGITFLGGSLPTGLVAGQVYYVRDKATNSFKLATSPNGAVVTFSTDGSGTITGRLQSPFYSTTEDSRTITFTGTSASLSEPIGQVLSAYVGTGDGSVNVTVTIGPGNTLVSPELVAPTTCEYTVQKAVAVVRIVKQLGSDTQAVNAALATLAPSRYTSNHRLRGNAYVAVTLDLEDVRFQGGPPNITADVSGRKVYDPRTATTAWSSNPALCIRDFLISPWGFEVASTDVDDATVITAANACDALISITVGSVTTTNVATFTCNGAFSTDGSRESVLQDMADSMAGAVSYGAKYRVLAGAWTAPVMALTDDDLHGQIDVVQADTPVGDLINGIRGQLMLAGAQSPSDFNPYQNATFLADDGRALWTDNNLPFTDNLARARNLCRIAVESNRSGQVIRYPAKLKAWPLEIGDRVTVTSAEYGLSAKAYRVTDWQFDPASAVVLTLQEDDATIYDLADAAVADPTPNTNLADPWSVPLITGITATSGGTTLQVQADGTVTPRVLVQWDQVDNGNVTGGGTIEVLWRSQQATAWTLTSVPGADVSTYLSGVDEGDTIIIEVRGRSARGRQGPSAFLSHLVVGKTAPPSDVVAFAAVVKLGQVVFSWTPCPDVDYAATELRVGASWAAAAFGWSGKASDYKLARPPNGTYTVWAKHLDTSGNYSTNAVSVTVVVDDSIDGGGGGSLVLTVSPAPLFTFANGTTHTSTSPDLTFTAHLVGLFGTANWTAEAFTALTGGTSLGAVALTGTGNARTMSVAQFVAPGTSGSVKRVDVTATLNGAFDSQSVYRYDPTVSGPFLYLDNPVVAVETDEAGANGNYTGATTHAAVILSGADDTTNWSFSITPDSGVSATINGGTGPVTGTATVTIAVSDMTIPVGAVLVTATKTGQPTQTATFQITKRPAQGVARLLYFSPRADIVLPVDSAGAVTDYTNAWTNALVRLASGADATAEYTFSKTDIGVTSTLTGNKIAVTGWVDLGTAGTAISTAISLTGTGWGRAAPVQAFGNGVWLQPGQDTAYDFNPFAIVKRSTDFVNWSNVALGSTGQWEHASYTAGAFMLGNNRNVNQALRSTDGGVTWTAVTLSVSAQRQRMAGQNGTFIYLAAGGSTASQRSTDAGATWSAIATPINPSDLWGVGINRWLFKDSIGGQKISLDNGSTWGATGALPASVSSAIGFQGLIVVGLFGTTASICYSETAGASFVTVPLPAALQNAQLLNIRGVLYAFGGSSGAFSYSTDGKTWHAGTTTSAAPMWLRSAEELDIDFLPLLGGTWIKVPLLATSATEGAVHVTASKAGETDLTGVIPVQRGAAVVNRVTNINPAVGLVPATQDGVVTDFTNASFACTVVENSTTVTGSYTWTWTATNLTPASGTGSTASFTAMSADSGRVTFTGVQAGKDVVTLSADVVKVKGGDTSGLTIGASYTVSSRTNTYIEFQLTSDGQVRQREGSSGTFVKAGSWTIPEGASVGAGAWVRYDTFGSVPGAVTVGGTLGSFLALTSSRGVSISATTPGDYLVQVVVYLSASSSGTNPRASLVTFALHVP